MWTSWKLHVDQTGYEPAYAVAGSGFSYYQLAQARAATKVKACVSWSMKCQR